MFKSKTDEAREAERQKRYEDLVEHYARTKEPYFDKRGHELPDSTPVEVPAGYDPGINMFDLVRQMIRQAQADIEAQEFDTEEEADDFEVDDDFEPTSGYEVMVEEVPASPPPARPLNEAPANSEPAPPSDGQGAPAVSEGPAGTGR